MMNPSRALWPQLARLLRSASCCCPVAAYKRAPATGVRCVSTTVPARGYEGDGKTTVSFVDQETGRFLMVDQMNQYGFKLTNGAFAFGPIILFPNIIFRWKVNSVEDINSESLHLFKVLEPRLDLLLVGIGEYGHWSPEALRSLREGLRQSGLPKVEILPTRQAVATYHWMLEDWRVVAAALLPIHSGATEKLIASRQ